MIPPKFPFFTLQQLNLDWVMQMLKKILAFMPIDKGAVGDVLQRKANGAAWEPLSAVSMDIHGLQTADAVADDDEIPIYDKTATGNRKATVAAIRAGVSSPVTSVNGKTGVVVLDASDVGLDNVDNVQQYSADNPPPYPVTSVNGQTGAVVIPTGGGAVDSVNGMTGAVVLNAAAVGALPNTTRYADLYFVGGLQPLTLAVNPALDASNDCEIIGAGIKYATSANKKTVRVCGTAKIECGSNTGWRTFEITGADIADFPTGVNYLHRDYCCTLYQDIQPARQICLAPTDTYVNYRVFPDKTMHFYLYVESWLAGQTVYVVFDDVFQIP